MLAMMYWLLVFVSVPGMFVLGCVYGYRATAPRPALVSVPSARVVDSGIARYPRELGAWSGRAFNSLARMITAVVAGLSMAFLDIVLCIAVAALLAELS